MHAMNRTNAQLTIAPSLAWTPSLWKLTNASTSK